MRGILLAVLLISFASFSWSQKNYDMGIRCSSHLNSWDLISDNGELQLSGGYSLGLRLSQSCKKNVVQLGLLFTQMDLGVVRYEPTGTEDVQVLKLQTECIELQTLFRHKFNNYKRVMPFVSAGASNFVIIGHHNYHRGVLPQGLRNNNEIRNTGYNVALVLATGIKCRLDERFTVDIEPDFKYFVCRNTNYKHNIAIGFGLSLNYQLRKNVLQTESLH
jgi:hypothetical protein